MTDERILRNQHAIMSALACLLNNNGGSATGYHAERLKLLMREIESLDLIEPSARISRP